MNVRVAVDAVIEKNGEVLLLKRAVEPFKGWWVLPGGGVKYGEQLVGAVKREVKEETGLKVKVLKYLGYYDKPGRDPRGHTISHAFLCKPISSKIDGSLEGREIKWFKKLPKKVGFDHRQIIEDSGVLNA